MAAGNFGKCLAEVLKLEGGFVQNAKDPGGATSLGVTIATWSQWIGRPATVQDIRDLTPESVSLLYDKMFWHATHCDLLPPGVDMITFDTAVNEGPGRAGRQLQEALGVDAGSGAEAGLVGPLTLQAASAADPAATIDKMAAIRSGYYESLPTFPTFGHGWLNRVAAVTAAAKAMLTT